MVLQVKATISLRCQKKKSRRYRGLSLPDIHVWVLSENLSLWEVLFVFTLSPHLDAWQGLGLLPLLNWGYIPQKETLLCSCSQDGCPDISHLWKLLGISHGIHQGQGWAVAPSPREIPSILPQNPQLETWLDENSDLLTWSHISQKKLFIWFFKLPTRKYRNKIQGPCLWVLEFDIRGQVGLRFPISVVKGPFWSFSETPPWNLRGPGTPSSPHLSQVPSEDLKLCSDSFDGIR